MNVCTINEHLQDLFDEGEWRPEATVQKFRVVQMEGQREVAPSPKFLSILSKISTALTAR
jgi:hypothetical protein